MQVPGFKIVLGTGAAIVLALAFDETSRLDVINARAAAIWATIPTAVVFLLPLLFTLIAWVLERLGLLQRVFGTLYKDLTDSQIGQGKHLTAKDKLRLTQRLERWKAPMPHLAHADSVLALWGGKERWSLAGFDRCWTVALIYPVVVLLLVWARFNNGQLGAATLILPVDDEWRRWLALTMLGATVAMFWAAFRAFEQPEQLRRTWLVRHIPLLNRVGDFMFVAAAFAFAFAAAVAFAFAGAFADAFTGAAALAFAVAFAVAFAFIGTVAGPSVGAVVVAVFGPSVGTFVDLSALAFAAGCSLAVVNLNARLRRKFSANGGRQGEVVAGLFVAYLAFIIAVAALLPALQHWGLTPKRDALAATGLPFVCLVLMGLLPLINALSDWVSLNTTRAFIARMQAGASRGEVGRLYFYDFAIALALTLIVYAAALGVIWLMQRFSWQVDVKSVLVELRDNPWSGQSTWLLTLAITNFLPTIYHCGLWLLGRVQSRDADTRSDIEQFLRDGGSSALRQIAPTIVSMLRIQPWLERAMVLSLTLALFPLFAICVPWAADWLLQRL